MELKVGSRFRSAASSAEVIVVRAPKGDVDLRCGGLPMVAHNAEVSEAAPLDDGQTELGKRYADDEVGIELLCTKAGAGSLSVGDRVLSIKGAKALPSSD